MIIEIKHLNKSGSIYFATVVYLGQLGHIKFYCIIRFTHYILLACIFRQLGEIYFWNKMYVKISYTRNI